MRRAGLNALLWSAFAGLILIGAYVVLNACDLGFRPLFGPGGCAAPTPNAALAAESAKAARLQSAVHAEEVRLALLPACLPPSQKVEPRLPPQKSADDAPTVDPKPVQPFEIPKRIEDLKGCWQSARGDIDIVSDDEERKRLGQARFCYCFKANGRGRVQIRYTDGDLCQADLSARISPDRVFMHHDMVRCHRHGSYVASEIRCGNDASNQTVCEIENFGRNKGKTTERFIRVSDERCGWGG
jgi:hypothetical protein